ncbi:hypothetical protein [Alistipes putredinis]|uniref:hypothetical protein n=1 Tax=Alistipes putredinis TaxID=28117 RepID=UPI003A95042F
MVFGIQFEKQFEHGGRHFEIVDQGAYDFVRVLTHSKQLQRQGRVEEACNERFHAFQRISELLPEDEEVILEWEDPNTRAALEVIHASAIDHFLINDFECLIRSRIERSLILHDGFVY